MISTYKNILVLFFIITLFACQNKPQKMPSLITAEITNYPMNSSIRAIAAIDSQMVWFAGSGGQFGYTENGGQNWTIDSIKHENKAPEFRSIVVTNSAVFLLSVASPALLYKSVDKGKNWDLVFTDTDTSAFYNSMTFVDDQTGFAVGDPQNGCLTLIKTTDGGQNWAKIGCDILPSTADGEAGFAASNTNVIAKDNHLWLVSGGKKARVFYSSDLGNKWEVFDTPIIQGGTMTGIFSAAFYDEKQGVIFGGNWEKQEHNSQNKAITKDGGKTWRLVNEEGFPGYRSCVQYIPNSDAEAMIAVGIPGIAYTADRGRTWQGVNIESYYTIRIVDEHTAWLAGKNRVALMKF